MNVWKPWKRRRVLSLPPAERVEMWGHRRYVGGANCETWYGIGKRQYHFLVSQGLKSRHRFLDVACGSLRLGQYLIPMLDTGNYFGLEGERVLVDAGLDKEILFKIAEQKKAKFAYNYDFDLSFCDGYDFAIAQSLYTHLNKDDIGKCFEALSHKANADSRFFFTFFEGSEEGNPPGQSHANKVWTYEFSTLAAIAREHGFACAYIGDWGHERQQMMAVAMPK